MMQIVFKNHQLKGSCIELVTIVCASLCLIYCVYAVIKSNHDIKQGHYGNYAQNVVTLGVLFTFIGVSISLYNFDVKNIDQSIGVFLEGMKLAFLTSIIGMVAGLIIKFLQRKHMDYASDQTSSFYYDMKCLRLAFEKYAKESGVSDNSLQAKLDDMNEQLRKNDMELFNDSLNKFCAAVNIMVAATQSSQNDMQRLSQNMSQQAQVLTNLGDYLKTSFDDMVEKQGKQMAEMNSMFYYSINELTKQINSMNTNLGDKISESGRVQAEKLGAMNALITTMKDSAVQSATYTKEMLDQTIVFHDKSIKNQHAQNDILRSNTESIVSMRATFADFVDNVQKVFGDAVINALNDSMNRLNDQLETQFGENFKELNMAVKDVVKWQQEYKDTVELTVNELKQIDAVFHQFIDVVSRDVETRISSLDASLKEFGNVNAQNIGIQKDLTNTTAQTAAVLVELQTNISKVEAILGSFENYAANVNAGVKEALEEQNKVIVDSIKELDKGISAAFDNSNANIKSMISLFNEYSAKSSVEIKQCIKTQNRTLATSMKAFDTEVCNVYNATVKDIANIQSELRKYLDDTKTTMAATTTAITKSTVETAGAIEDLKKAALAMVINVNSYMNSMEETTKNVQKNIGKTLEGFSSEFSEQAEEAVGNLEEMFKKLALETEKQHDKSVKTLAASLAAISNQMIDNYTALVTKIEQVDRMLKGR